MRNALAKVKGERKKFRATFSRIGKKTNYKGYTEETVLLRNIVDVESDTIVADHLWFSYVSGFEKISLTEGTQLEFEARVKVYRKGYVNRQYDINHGMTDYKLSHPTKIMKLESHLI